MEARGSARVSVTGPAMRRPYDVAIDFDHAVAQMTFTPDDPRGITEVRDIGDTIYTRFGAGPWLKTRPTHTGLTELDPRTILSTLSSRARNVAKAGSETVQGTETTRYRLTVRASGSGLAAGKEGTTVPVDVWVDGDGLVRRARATYPSFGAVTWAFSDFGVPVHVQPPPASQIAPGQSLGDDQITPLKSG